MKHNLQAFKKYYSNASKDEVIEDMFLDCCSLQARIDKVITIIETKQNIEKSLGGITLFREYKILKILKGEENENI